ncbi:MAG TPA: branched-chain amino acid ABC transporter permease [Deltaproteobacteria bacterium]|nr:branched-chain amino acid ABC transporter permease [Deltaproteobacteria bacterium]
MPGSNDVRRNILLSVSIFTILALSPLFLSIYWTMILTEILIMGLFAMSFNLLFGYSGLLSFGQAGFFGLGAYAATLSILHGVKSVWLAMVIGLGVSALGALLIGFLCVRRDEIFFAMLTLGFGMMIYTVAHNWRELTGGSDGLSLFLVPLVHVFGFEFSIEPPVAMYYFTLCIASLGVFILWRVIQSPFGLMLKASRENKDRLYFVGANVQTIRLFAFVISGTLAGLSGVLFSLFNHMAAPSFVHWSFSARPVLMTILGGCEIFFGPACGAAIFFVLEQLVTTVTENWMIVLGAILIPVVIFTPKGILGTVVSWFSNRRVAR